MKKSILYIGKVINQEKQKNINGGRGGLCCDLYGCVFPECAEGQPCELESPGPVIWGVITNGLCCAI